MKWLKTVGVLIAALVVAVLFWAGLTYFSDELILTKPDFVNNPNKTSLVSIDLDDESSLEHPSMYLAGADCNGQLVPLSNTDCPAYGRFEDGKLVLGVHDDPDLLNKTVGSCVYVVADCDYNNAYIIINYNGSPFLITADKWLVFESLVGTSTDHLGSNGGWFDPFGEFNPVGQIVYIENLTGAGFGYVGNSTAFGGYSVNYYSVGKDSLDKYFNLAFAALKVKKLDQITELTGVIKTAIIKKGTGYIVCVSIDSANQSQMKCIHTPAYPNDETDIQFWTDGSNYPYGQIRTEQTFSLGYVEVYTIDK